MVRMSDLEHVILSSHTVFIPLKLVYIKYRKPCTPYTEDDLCQANDRSMLQSQTNTTCVKRDLKKYTQERNNTCIDKYMLRLFQENNV